jgi:glycosyltransferase involved in cell wall biosynthesis
MSIKFSVVIPLFNKELYILKALQSVFNQKHSDFEVIVVDDSSTDNSLALVKRLKDERIKIISHKNNMGLSATRNTGITAAKNNYIAFLDADDFWHVDFLSSIIELINRFPDEKVFATYYTENFNNKLLKPKIKLASSQRGKFFIVTNFFNVSLGKSILTQSGMAVHKTVLKDIKNYNPLVTFAEDLDFYTRCLSKFNLAYYYKSCYQINSTVANSLARSNTSDKIYPDLKKHLGDNDDLNSYIYFNIYSFCQRLKLEGRNNESKNLISDINLNYLSLTQKVLLFLPGYIYKPLLFVKNKCLSFGFQLSSY